MTAAENNVRVVVEVRGERIVVESPLTRRLVLIVNTQFTNAPNTTQIASGAGRSSAAGNNVTVDSSNTLQQQSVGADGQANNSGMDGEQLEKHPPHKRKDDEHEVTVVVNTQINETGEVTAQASATQVASGGGVFSAAGTNAAIESSNTKQQHAVGGGGSADNSGMDDAQIEVTKKRGVWTTADGRSLTESGADDQADA
jgi:hypothetical protein